MIKKVNCIIPAYNVARYLRDAINSVVNQTIGFKNINLVVVDDGSTDNTEDIVEAYKYFYPNIIYIKQENQGASAARNRGLDFCQKHFDAPYTCFLDGDDKYSLKQMEVLANFLEKNPRQKGGDRQGPEVAFVPIKLFEKETDTHYAYKAINRGKTRIIDLREEKVVFQNVQNAMFRSDAIRNVRFDENLEISEDVLFLLKVFRKANLVGWCNEQNIHLHFRKRVDESSILDNSASNPKFYERISIFRKEFEKNIKELGYVPLIVQNNILYEIQWFHLPRLEPKQYGINMDMSQMWDDITYMISNIEKELLEQSYIPYWYRALFKRMKYGNVHLRKSSNEIIARFYFGEEPFETLAGHIKVRFINQVNSRLLICGFFIKPSVDNIHLVCCHKGEHTYATLKGSSEYGIKGFLGEEIFPTTAFEFDIDISDLGASSEDVLAFYFKHEETMEPAIMVHSRFSRFCNENSFIIGDKAVVKKGLARHLLEIEKVNISSVSKQVLGKINNYKDHYLLKKYVELFETFRNRRIWLFINFYNRMDDSVDALFRYCCSIDDGIEKFMVISEGSYYENFRGISSNIIIFGSFEYKFLVMYAEKYISSTTFYDSNTALKISKDDFRKISNSLSNFEEVFLQNSVIQNTENFRDYVSKTRRDLTLFCAASPKDYNNILKRSRLTKNQIKLTGMPRFDLLKSNPEKVITLALSLRTTAGDVEAHIHNSRFRKSPYFNMLNELINDVHLLEALRVYEYRFIIKMHPQLYAQKKELQIPEEIEIIESEISYRKLCEISSLMITDYSSAVFDFAYLRKPVIYFHEVKTPAFDGGKRERDYVFDYEKDGFGAVIDNQKDCVNKITSYMKNGCVMETKYKERVYKYFVSHDTRNSERVYQELINIKKRKG